MALHWYKRFAEDALMGMKGLTLEERGAYNTALDLIYLRDGALDDDDQFIAGWCSCDVRVWRRIKARLIALDKLYLDGGKLRNGRADDEVARALAKGVAASYAGQQSARIRAGKSRDVSNGNNGQARTGVPTEAEQNSNHTQKPRINNLDLTTRAADAARASASPDGPPPARLTSPEEWKKRLDAWLESGKWSPTYGLRPDSSGHNPIIPPDLYQWAKAQKAQQRTGAQG